MRDRTQPFDLGDSTKASAPVMITSHTVTIKVTMTITVTMRARRLLLAFLVSCKAAPSHSSRKGKHMNLGAKRGTGIKHDDQDHHRASKGD